MAVDSYRWLPRSLKAYYQAIPIERTDPPPFARPAVPLGEATVALVTTGGLYIRGEQEPFDLDRERREPAWGDPSFRALPRDLRQDQVAVAHLHYNNTDVSTDVNCVFPIHRLTELAAAGEVGRAAPTHYSFMGFQLDQSEQLTTFVPQVIDRMKREEVHAAVLTPA